MNKSRPIDQVENSRAAQAALMWWYDQPEPRDVHDMVKHLRVQFVTLFLRALSELPAHVSVVDISAAFDFDRVSGAPAPTLFDSAPGDLTEVEQARWEAIASERSDIAAAITAVRAELALVATEVAINGTGEWR